MKIKLLTSKIFRKKDLLWFSRISGDFNPIHIDEEKASESIFGKRVVHGVLLLSMFSKIFGTIYPGNGAIYLSQSGKFLKPAFIEENIIAKAKLTFFDESNFHGTFLTECFKNSDTLIFTGESNILFPKTFTL